MTLNTKAVRFLLSYPSFLGPVVAKATTVPLFARLVPDGGGNAVELRVVPSPNEGVSDARTTETIAQLSMTSFACVPPSPVCSRSTALRLHRQRHRTFSRSVRVRCRAWRFQRWYDQTGISRSNLSASERNVEFSSWSAEVHPSRFLYSPARHTSLPPSSLISSDGIVSRSLADVRWLYLDDSVKQRDRRY